MRLTVKDGQFDKDGGYTERSYQADLNDAYVLLEKLLESKDSLHFQSDCFGLDYRYLSDTSFEVEIYDIRDGFWAISEVGILAARKIMEIVSENMKFGETVPTTNKVWGAYGGGDFV